MGLSQIIFVVFTSFVFYFAFRQYYRIYQNIRLGKDYNSTLPITDRLKNVILVAFGQQKMFKKLIPAVFHFFIYAAFIFTQMELIEVILDGVTGHHRILLPYLGMIYPLILNIIEILSLLALIATFVFLYRRNLLKIPRFVKSDLDGWPRLDANLILVGEVLLVIAIFTMNGSDEVLQKLDAQHYPTTGNVLISGWLGPAIFDGFSMQTLMVFERLGWWMHLVIVYGFILYLPQSKHLHIFFAFPNVYYYNGKPRGEMANMPEIMHEVKTMLGIPSEQNAQVSASMEFGANDIFGLSWKNILDSYSCTECGRCSSVCPANLTGKKLSPRKIIMAVRDRTEEVGKNIGTQSKEFYKEGSDQTEKLSSNNYYDGKSLFEYISREEIHACTTCQACVEACPVLINPLEPILEMRRYEILTESAGPGEWIPMFTAMENSGSVWQMPIARDNWKNELAN